MTKPEKIEFLVSNLRKMNQVRIESGLIEAIPGELEEFLCQERSRFEQMSDDKLNHLIFINFFCKCEHCVTEEVSRA